MLFDGEIIVSWKKWDRVKFHLETSRAFIGKFIDPHGKNTPRAYSVTETVLSTGKTVVKNTDPNLPHGTYVLLLKPESFPRKRQCP